MGGGGKSLIDTVFEILQGRAHMWFLPMLLWCFLLCYGILRIEKIWLRWLIVGVLLICSRFYMPFQISATAYYILYFYLGYDIYLYSGKIRNLTSNLSVFSSWVLFVFIFIMATLVIETLHGLYIGNNILYKILISVATMLLKVSYSVIGIISIFLTSYQYTNGHGLKTSYIKIGEYSFGVYLIQQFILDVLYYKTTIPCQINNLWLPWIGFLFTLVISLLLSYLIKITKIGNKII